MHKPPMTQLACFALLLVGCASLASPECEAPETVRVYQAADIDEQWINFVWVEIPGSVAEGTFPGRLFVASADPVGAVVPSMIDLPCQLSSADDAVAFSPAPVEIEFQGSGNFKTSYAWKSCAQCSECYMQWTFSLDLQGHVDEGFLVADLVLNETFHSAPMKIVSLKMPEVTQACTQPHVSCRPGGDCSAIRFEARR